MNATPVVVRLAGREDDLAAAGEVVRAGYLALPGYPRDDEYDHEIGDVASRIDSADVVIAELVSDDTRRVVGCLTFVVDHTNRHAEHGDPGAASFRFFAVSPDAQGLGVGEAMVQFVIDRARALGKQRLRIHTLEMMHAAMRLYERLGFRRDPSHDADWEGVTGVAYVLDL